MKCPSTHRFSGVRCILEQGHEGCCTSKAYPNKDAGTVTRAEWYSKYGRFTSHKQYVTDYPLNAAAKEAKDGQH